jgi:hypothetical protein
MSTRSESFHAVQFYKDDSALTGTVSRFLSEGFSRAEPALIVAIPAHISAIERALVARGYDVRRMEQLGDLVVLDAHETLDTFMADGMPHEEVFDHVVGKTLAEVARIHPDRTIRAFGEMVNVLWQDGLTAGAICLERLWNKLAAAYDLQLLCGYSMGNLYKNAAVGEITRHHTHLIDDDGQRATIN